jgi:hypothetical protein
MLMARRTRLVVRWTWRVWGEAKEGEQGDRKWGAMACKKAKPGLGVGG